MALNTGVFAQPAPREKKQLKDFGWSLKKFKTGETKKSDETPKPPPPQPSRAQQQPQQINLGGEEPIRVKTELVVTDVLVVDQRGNAVAGLKEGDFVIAEDGVEQKIELFSSKEEATVPHSIVLIIDSCIIIPEHLKNSLQAAKNLVDKLSPRDKMAIVTDKMKLLTHFTSDKSALKAHLDVLMARKRITASDGGRGEQFSSLLAALNELFDDTNARRIVIIQSAGGELFLLRPIRERLRKKHRQRDFGLNDVMAAVEKSGATVYPIIPGRQLVGLPKTEQVKNLKTVFNIRYDTNWNGKEYRADVIEKELEVLREEFLADQTALVNIAKLSGGYASFFSKAEDAESIYSDILSVINDRYVVGYYPTNEERNGRLRNIKIEVRGHPEYKVLGRKSYIAPE